MTKTQAEEIYTLVNHPAWPIYMQYKQDRLSANHAELEWCKPEEIKKPQGRIEEIRNDLNLHKTVIEMFKIQNEFN